MSLKNAVKLAAQEKLRKHERTVEDGLLSFVEVGKALGMIRLEKLYALAGFADFDTYVEQRFTISPRHADRLISAARVVLLLGPIGLLIKNESTARELAVFGRNDTDKMRAVVEAATTDGRVTAAAVRTVRDELYPEYRTIEGQFREGGRRELEPGDAKRCESCPAEIPWSDWTAGQLRCRSCDPSSLHRATAVDGEFTEVCAECSRIASQTTGSGDGPSPVAGSGPEERDEEEADDFRPIEGETVAGLHRRWLDRGLPAHTWQEWLERWEATYSPAADEMPHIPTAGASPTLAPQQPGQDSPTGLEGARSETDSPTGQGRVSHEGRAAEAPDRSETDHHRAGVSGGGHAPDEVTSVELEELEDGGVLPPESPSSGDPELLLELFAAILQALDRVDVGALAPLLLTEEMQRLHEAADRVATFVGLLETWRTP